MWANLLPAPARFGGVKGRATLPRAVVILTMAAVALAAALLCAHLATGGARADLARQADVRAALNAAALRSAIGRFAFAPVALAEDADVRRVLARGGDVAALNEKLERLNAGMGSAAIYILDSTGLTLAASNWRTPESFIGANYDFRPYYRDAMAEGVAEMFALGTTTNRPGLYLSRRVGAGAGVVVLKVPFDELEADWAVGEDRVFVTNAEGIVLITTEPDSRFRSIEDISLPRGGGAWERAEVIVHDRWRLHLAAPPDRAVARAGLMAGVAGGFGATLVFAGGSFALARRRRAQRASAELEARVRERTAALEASHMRLVVEIDERRRAEARLDALQHEMIQAHKLAVLGQVTAGVAHEVNQPLAALRAYAENAAAFLKRGGVDEAAGNLAAIIAAADRVGAITDELRAFARKGKGAPGPIPLRDALAGAQVLTAGRIRSLGARLVEPPWPEPAPSVIADRVRLEQVFVNLLQNALDAAASAREPEIRVGLDISGREARVIVQDNGPGVAPEMAAGLFTPFTTDKPGGLGLGLVISRDIARSFGGDLSYEPDAGAPGARFVLRLRLAP